MTAYLPEKGRTIYKVRLEVAPGVWVARSTGTRDKRLAGRIHAMCRALGGREARAWDVLGKVRAAEWSLMDLWDRYERSGQDVTRMRALMADATLATLHAPFLASIRSRRSADTAQHYAVYLRALEDAGIVLLSDLTVKRLSSWVDALSGSAGTRRKYAAGVSAFCAWLVRRGDLTANPMRDVQKPAPAPSRVAFLETPDAIRLADAQPAPFRQLSALLHGTGLDLSVALTLTRRQIDTAAWSITSRRAKTGKGHSLLIAEWSRPYVAELVRGKLPDAPLFPGVDRFQAGKQHRAACLVCDITGYWLRDARHSWAVRFMRAGGSAQQAAEQLGHHDGGVLALKVYGRYVPSLAERNAVDQRASAAERGA